jgi:hypothetical protein
MWPARIASPAVASAIVMPGPKRLTPCATFPDAGAQANRGGCGFGMDLSKLGQHEKLALYSAIVLFLTGLISNWGGLLWLAVLAALGVAVVVLLPQLSPSTSLPGSRGTLLAALGIVAAGSALIELLRWLGYTLDTLGRLSTLLFLVSLIASFVMAWAGWSELQREGGKWVFGSTGVKPAPATATPSADATDASAGSAAATDAPPADTYRPDDEARPTS